MMDQYRCPHCRWRLFDASMPDGGQVETKCNHCKRVVVVIIVKGKGTPDEKECNQAAND